MRQALIFLWLSSFWVGCHTPAPSSAAKAGPLALKPGEVEETPAATPTKKEPTAPATVPAATQPSSIATKQAPSVTTTQPTSVATKPAPVRIPKGSGKALPVLRMEIYEKQTQSSPKVSYSYYTESSLVLSLFDNGVVKLTDQGIEASLMLSWEAVQFDQAWKNQWSGKWFERGSELVVELKAACEDPKKAGAPFEPKLPPDIGWMNYFNEAAGCKASGARTLSCETKSITTDTGKSVDALFCVTTEGFSAGSKGPLVFGKKSCLTRRGETSFSYQECSK